MAIELPKVKIKAELQNPRRLLIYSSPKRGKSSACAALPNALCIDLEDGGYDYIDAVKIKASTVKEIKEICKAILNAGKPYEFIVLDTITRLEDIVKPLALQLFQATPAGSDFKGTDVLTAAHGAGYGALRSAMEMVIDMVAKCAPNLILVGHAKDAAIGSGEQTIKQIDLLGKESRILASKSDGIGFKGSLN